MYAYSPGGHFNAFLPLLSFIAPARQRLLAASPPSLIKGWVTPAGMFCLIGLCLRCFRLCSLRKNPPETRTSPGNHLIYSSTIFLSVIKCLVIELLSCKVLSRWQQLRRLAGCIFSDIDWRRREQTHGASPAKQKRETLKYQMCLEAGREGSEVRGHASF